MTDTELEALFRDWWPYPAPPGSHALMTHLGWGRFLLERGASQNDAPESAPDAEMA
jgi:hypothetical protein